MHVGDPGFHPCHTHTKKLKPSVSYSFFLAPELSPRPGTGAPPRTFAESFKFFVGAGKIADQCFVIGLILCDNIGKKVGGGQRDRRLW